MTRILKTLLPFFVALLIIPLVLFFDQKTSVLSLGSQIKTSHFDIRNLLTEINVLRTHLRLLVWPVNQNLDYDYPLTQGLDLATIFSLSLLSILVAGVVFFYRKNRLVSFAIVWFFIATSVEFSVYALIGKGMIFEHHLYLPMAGFSLLASIVLVSLLKRRNIFFIVMGLFILVLGVRTYQRNKIWHDPFTLWHDAAAKSPNKYRPYANLGVAYRRAGDYDKAIIYHSKALSLGPIEDKEKAQIYVNLAAAYGNKGLYEEEIAYCKEAIKLDPYLAQAYSNIGFAYSLLGRYDEAVEYGQKAVSFNPYSAEFFNNLGVAYAGKGEMDKALDLFETALQFEPTHPNALQNRDLARKLVK